MYLKISSTFVKSLNFSVSAALFRRVITARNYIVPLLAALHLFWRDNEGKAAEKIIKLNQSWQ